MRSGTTDYQLTMDTPSELSVFASIIDTPVHEEEYNPEECDNDGEPVWVNKEHVYRNPMIYNRNKPIVYIWSFNTITKHQTLGIVDDYELKKGEIKNNTQYRSELKSFIKRVNHAGHKTHVMGFVDDDCPALGFYSGPYVICAYLENMFKGNTRKFFDYGNNPCWNDTDMKTNGKWGHINSILETYTRNSMIITPQQVVIFDDDESHMTMLKDLGYHTINTNNKEEYLDVLNFRVRFDIQ